MIAPSKIEMSSMTTDQFYSKCMNMSSDYFSMNKNKCNDVKTVYGKTMLSYLKYIFSGVLIEIPE